MAKREESHANMNMPGWEYLTTQSARKQGGGDPPENEGWEPNDIIDNGEGFPRRNWERYDFHEDHYWRRRVPASPSPGDQP